MTSKGDQGNVIGISRTLYHTGGSSCNSRRAGSGRVLPVHREVVDHNIHHRSSSCIHLLAVGDNSTPLSPGSDGIEHRR